MSTFWTIANLLKAISSSNWNTDAWGRFTNIPGTTVADAQQGTVAINQNGTLEIFYIGRDNNL